MKKISHLLSIIFLLSLIAGCQAELTDPIISQSETQTSDSTLEEWDPDKVLVPGINLLTFTDGDRTTPFPYYQGDATYSVKFKIVSGTSASDGQIDPGVYTVKVEYSDDNGSNWTTLPAAGAIPTSAGSEGSYSWSIPGAQPEGILYLIKLTATNAAGKTISTQSSRNFVIDSTPPVINSFGLTAGSLGVVSVGDPTDDAVAKVVNRSFFETTVAASDTVTKINFICVKAFDSNEPAADDSCWQALDTEASTSLIKTNITTFVGFVQNTYKISVWAMDQAANISGLTAGTGDESKDQITIAYNPAVAPTITNMIGSTNDSSSLSPTKAQTTFTQGQDLYVRWKVTDTDLVTAPISLYYTTDEITYTPITNMQDITNDAVGCTIDSNFTGCRKISAPSTNYFKIQIKVKDQSGLISLSATPGLNTGKFSIVAGNTDLGLNGSANKAIFLNNFRAADVPGDFGTFAVSSKGKIYFLDANRGVLMVDPTDGVQKLYLAKGSTNSGNDGPVSMATTVGNGKINIDHKDRLLIYETTGVRRVEADGTISQIIGGGSITDRTKAVAAKSAKFNIGMSMFNMFQVLPNGNIWFTASRGTDTVLNYTIGIYKASEDKVYFMKLSGKGIKGDPEYVFTTDYIRSIGVAFNYRTSQAETLVSYICFPVPGGCKHLMANFNARNGVSVGYGVHPPAYAYWETSIFPSRRGAIHFLGGHYPFKLGRYNLATNTWTTLVGKQTQGYCPDGTLASTCGMAPNDAFVDGTDTVYFVDGGQIRVILPDGKTKTLFGERKSAGDGSSPLAARFNEVNYLGVWGTSDTVIAADNKEFNVREIAQGSSGIISRLAGNSTDESISFEAPSTNRYSINTASQASFANEFWGGVQGIQVDPRDGTFYASLTRNDVIVKYERDDATGKVGKFKLVLGAGSTSFQSSTANNLVGSSVKNTGYPITLNGIMVPDGSTIGQGAIENGSSTAFLIAFTHNFDSTAPGCHANPYSKILSASNGTVRKFIGASNGCYTNMNYVDDGSDASDSDRMPIFARNSTSAVYLKEERAVLMANLQGQKIIKAALNRNGSDMITGGGASSVWTTTSKKILNFTYKKNASSQYELYYCASDGTLNKKNLTTGTETVLELPTSVSGTKFFTCAGLKMTWDYNKEQIYFPFRQNGLSGVGKYCVTTTGTCP